MRMRVMNVGHVCMRMPKWLMAVPVTVRAYRQGHVVGVYVLVMPIVVGVRVFVFKRVMRMLVVMGLRQMQRNAQQHEQPADGHYQAR